MTSSTDYELNLHFNRRCHQTNNVIRKIIFTFKDCHYNKSVPCNYNKFDFEIWNFIQLIYLFLSILRIPKLIPKLNIGMNIRQFLEENITEVQVEMIISHKTKNLGQRRKSFDKAKLCFFRFKWRSNANKMQQVYIKTEMFE